MTKNRHRILIVDDDVLVSRSIQLVLETAGFTTCTAGTGREAVRRAFDERPHLVILDVGMPGVDGFTILERLHDQSDIPVIMLTGHSGVKDKVKGLDLGAVDYMTKPFAAEELLAHIRLRLHEAQARQKPTDKLVQTNFLSIDFGAHRLLVEQEPVNLTPIEWKLLHRLVERQGEVVSYEQLGQAGWGDAEYADERAIKVRISTIRKKLRDDARNTRYIHTEREVGYRFEPME